jgi:hypothetical protein
MEPRIVRTSRDVNSSSLTGYNVESPDGAVGVVADADYDALADYLVIDTGPWIFGRKLLVPVEVIDHVDLDTETVWLNRPREEIENGPELGELAFLSDTQLREVATYYRRSPQA